MKSFQVQPNVTVPGVTPGGKEGHDRIHAWTDPRVPVEQQWEEEAQGPEHDGENFEQRTCLR